MHVILDTTAFDQDPAILCEDSSNVGEEPCLNFWRQ